MKKIFTYLIIIFITFLTLSCNDDKSDDSEPDYILPSCNELTFKSKGEEKKITISSNTDWYIENESAWCYTSVTEGENTQTIIVYAEPNEENQERKTELKIKTKNDKVTPYILSIVQEKKGVQGKLSFTIKSGDVKSIDWQLEFTRLILQCPQFDTLSFPGAKEVIIDWGDGSIENYSQISSLKHKYNRSGTYTITIEGEDIYCCSLAQVYGLSIPTPEIPDHSITKITIQCSTLEAFEIYVMSHMFDNVWEPESFCSMIDFSECPNLKYINTYAPIKKIDVSNCKELKILEMSRSKFSDIDLTNNTKLIYCDLDMANCTSIDLSSCTLLEELYIDNSQFRSVDISNCPALTYLSCTNNNLTSLDVSKNTALRSLYCGNNSLTSLDLTKNTALTYLACYHCNLSASALNKIFNDLPQGHENSRIHIGDNPGSSTCDRSIAKNKGWSVWY